MVYIDHYFWTPQKQQTYGTLGGLAHAMIGELYSVVANGRQLEGGGGTFSPPPYPPSSLSIGYVGGGVVPPLPPPPSSTSAYGGDNFHLPSALPSTSPSPLYKREGTRVHPAPGWGGSASVANGVVKPAAQCVSLSTRVNQGAVLFLRCP